MIGFRIVWIIHSTGSLLVKLVPINCIKPDVNFTVKCHQKSSNQNNRIAINSIPYNSLTESACMCVKYTYNKHCTIELNIYIKLNTPPPLFLPFLSFFSSSTSSIRPSRTHSRLHIFLFIHFIITIIIMMMLMMVIAY